ncbi:MAG TPA: hypothetical protein VM096_13555 [Vicinamibacterales bacterium]|nr:hypothetical protein [Vicinamibacterales bacterium]
MKIKSVLGVIAGAILILSAFAHSIAGWAAMREQLAKTNAPPDLVQGLQIGWMFGGPVMVVFGILCISTFLKRLRGQPASTFAPVLIAMAYLAFGVWAAVTTGGDPFFMVFIVPAVLLAIASMP